MPQSFASLEEDVSSSENDLLPASLIINVASSPLAVKPILTLNSSTPPLGCAFIELPDRGAKIVGVAAGSVADEAGFCVGDIISSFNTVPVVNLSALKLAYSRSNPGDLVSFGILRAERNLDLSVRLAHGSLFFFFFFFCKLL